MAFNAFEKLTLSEDGETVFLGGKTELPFKAARIEAAIIDASDQNRRLQAFIEGGGVEGIIESPWAVELDQSGLDPDKKPFEASDTVLIAGVATSLDGELFIWGDVFGEPLNTLVPTNPFGVKTSPKQ